MVGQLDNKIYKNWGSTNIDETTVFMSERSMQQERTHSKMEYLNKNLDVWLNSIWDPKYLVKNVCLLI